MIADVRFPNEAEYVRNNGTLIHVVGRGGIEGSHISEGGLPIKPADLVVANTGTLSDLKAVALVARIYLGLGE